MSSSTHWVRPASSTRARAGNIGPYTTPWGPFATRPVPVTGVGGVPSGADSVAANVTVTDGDTGGYLTIWPAGASRPTASSLNWVAGQTISNAVAVKLSAGGQLSVYNYTGDVDVVVDVDGWYG